MALDSSVSAPTAKAPAARRAQRRWTSPQARARHSSGCHGVQIPAPRNSLSGWGAEPNPLRAAEAAGAGLQAGESKGSRRREGLCAGGAPPPDVGSSAARLEASLLESEKYKREAPEKLTLGAGPSPCPRRKEAGGPWAGQALRLPLGHVGPTGHQMLEQSL